MSLRDADGDPSPTTGNTARVDRPRRAHARVPALRDGPDGAAPRGAVAQRGPPAEQCATALDRRHLRVHGCGLPRHDGDARRPHRSSPAVDDRRSGVRRRLGARRVLDQPRDADREPSAARHRGRDAGTGDALADLQHVPRPAAAHDRDRGVDHGLLGGRRGRPGARGRAPRELLVGLGLPDGPARHGAVARAGAEAAAGVPRTGRGAPRPHERGSVAGRDPGGHLRAQADRAGRHRVGFPSPPYSPGSRSAWCSCGVSDRSTTR